MTRAQFLAAVGQLWTSNGNQEITGAVDRQVAALIADYAEQCFCDEDDSGGVIAVNPNIPNPIDAGVQFAIPINAGAYPNIPTESGTASVSSLEIAKNLVYFSRGESEENFVKILVPKDSRVTGVIESETVMADIPNVQALIDYVANEINKITIEAGIQSIDITAGGVLTYVLPSGVTVEVANMQTLMNSFKGYETQDTLMGAKDGENQVYQLSSGYVIEGGDIMINAYKNGARMHPGTEFQIMEQRNMVLFNTPLTESDAIHLDFPKDLTIE